MSDASAASHPESWGDHVVLCGLGTVGVSVTESLLQAGVRVVVVDNGPPTPFRRTLDSLGVLVVEGDCTHPETLLQAGVARARAVIVVVSHDMVSLQTALAAREINAEARIIIRLFNLRTANLLRDLPAGITALSLSATVAQVFTLAARCSALRGAFTLGGAIWAIGSLTAPSQGEALPLEHWRRAGLAPLACTSQSGEIVMCPSPTLVPAPGSTVLVAAAPDRLEAISARSDTLVTALNDPAAPLPALARPTTARRRSRFSVPRSFLVRLRKGFRLFWTRTNRILRIALITLFGLVVASVLIFYLFYPLSFLDALYFTTELVTTVGLGDISLLRADGPLKVFGIFVMLGGAAMMAVVYGLLAELVLSSRLEALLGEPTEDVRDHYVVAGLGAVGFRVVSALHEAGERVVVIESSESGRFIPQLRALRIPLIQGDAAQEETLQRAHIGFSRAFIAATSNDLVNIEAVLTARAMQPGGHVVLRVFDPALAIQVRSGLGISSSFSASQIGAPAFVGAALGHDVPQMLSLPVVGPSGDVTRQILLTHVRVGEDDLGGRSVGEIASARGGTPVLVLPAGDSAPPEVAPPMDRMLALGETLVLATAS
ncbi:MAG TPA: NAD-binding protein [Chloroflexota bacterium]|nr:NAD-binding protein [Chloroflexota bacterium]